MIPVPERLVQFIIGFAPGNMHATGLCAVTLVGYYWAIMINYVMRCFALGCLRGWS